MPWLGLQCVIVVFPDPTHLPNDLLFEVCCAFYIFVVVLVHFSIVSYKLRNCFYTINNYKNVDTKILHLAKTIKHVTQRSSSDKAYIFPS